MEEPVHLIDIFPTICALLALDPPSQLDGRDILHHSYEHARLLWRNLVVIRGPRFKLIRDIEGGAAALADLVEDPSEQKDFAQTHPEALAQLQAEADRWLATLDLPLAAAQSRRQQEKLRSLGYLP